MVWSSRPPQALRSEIPVILITAFGSIETAIEAMKSGAFHYVVKPFKLAEMAVNVDRALEHRKLRRTTPRSAEVKRSWIWAATARSSERARP